YNFSESFQEEILVRMRGLEPPRVLPHRLLRPARLPVPPHPHCCCFEKRLRSSNEAILFSPPLAAFVNAAYRTRPTESESSHIPQTYLDNSSLSASRPETPATSGLDQTCGLNPEKGMCRSSGLQRHPANATRLFPLPPMPAPTHRNTTHPHPESSRNSPLMPAM